MNKPSPSPSAFKQRTMLAATLVLGIGIGVAGAAGGKKLIYAGKVASINVQSVNGTTYVPLNDMAKALHMDVVLRPDGYELVSPYIGRGGPSGQGSSSGSSSGGAYGIGQGGPSGGGEAVVLTGKSGAVLFDGKWRFQVIKTEKPDSYTMTTDADTYDSAGLTTFDRTSHVVRPSRGRNLVVVYCRVANGVKEKRTLWTAISDGKIHTALTDTEGSSHVPVAYDFVGAPTQTKWLLPGEALKFAIVFSAPEKTRLESLIFTLKNNQTEDPPTDVRVSL